MSDDVAAYVSRTPEGAWRIAGTRVSLDSVVHAYWEGHAPESIAAQFPSLTFEQVYGAITFYLRHRAEVDAHLSAQDAQWERVRRESEERNGPLLRRLRQVRQDARHSPAGGGAA